MKKLIVIALVALMAVISLAGCESRIKTTTSNSIASIKAVDMTVAESQEAIKVEFGDFEKQKTVSKSIQNFEYTDRAIEIEGISKKLGTNYSVGQQGDSEFIGTTYEFDGDYPADGAHVKLVGKVVTEGLVSKIVASTVEVVE